MIDPWPVIGWVLLAVFAVWYVGAAVQSWIQWRTDLTAPAAVALAVVWPAAHAAAYVKETL